MGTFQVAFEIGDATGSRFERMDALVNTGATYPVVPKDTLESLGYKPIELRPFALADGRVVEYDVGVVTLRFNGTTMPVPRVFGDEGSEPLLGALALEVFLLAVDPVNQTADSRQRQTPVTSKIM